MRRSSDDIKSSVLMTCIQLVPIQADTMAGKLRSFKAGQTGSLQNSLGLAANSRSGYRVSASAMKLRQHRCSNDQLDANGDKSRTRKLGSSWPRHLCNCLSRSAFEVRATMPCPNQLRQPMNPNTPRAKSCWLWNPSFVGRATVAIQCLSAVKVQLR